MSNIPKMGQLPTPEHVWETVVFFSDVEILEMYQAIFWIHKKNWDM